jgi:hypothetical protein
MKTKLFGIILLALITLISCKEKAHENHEAAEEAVEEIAGPDYAGFDKTVALIQAMYQAHCDENFAAQEGMVSDSLKWSPPYYNGNEWLGKEAYLASIKGYHDNFDNIKYTAGIAMPDSLAGGYWSGSAFPKETATIMPTNIRVYGTWTATHTESGKDIGVKWFSLVSLNEDGKLVQVSDYFDVNGIATQIAAE